MTLADRLERYQHRVSVSMKWRKNEGYADTWQRMIALYKGEHYDTLTDEDKIVVNEAFGIVNVIYPSVSVNQPKISVSARSPEDHARGVILEAVVNYWWKHFDIRKDFRRAVKDFLIIGHGWLKCGWRFVQEDQELSSDEYEKSYSDAIGQADAYAAENPHLAAELPTDDEIRANLPTSKRVTAMDAPFIERVSPDDIFVDPEATCEADMKWIAQRIVRPIEEVRSDRSYKQSARRKVKATARLDTYDAEKGRFRGKTDVPEDNKRVVLWEYWDLRDGHLCVFADDCDEFLVEPVKQPYAYGHPFVMLRNYDVPDEFYPMGDLEAIEPMQRELNETRSQMVNHRRKFARKHLYRKDAFTQAGRNALMDDRDNVLVEVASDEAFENIIAPIRQLDNLPADFYNQSELIEGDLQRVSGVNEYMRGSLPEIRRTATEASIIQDAANARAADKLAVVEAAIGEVGRRMVQLAQQYLTGEHVVRIMGNDGQPLWVPFEHEDITGEYDYEVEGGSTMPKDENSKRQRAMAMLSTFAPFIESGLLNVPELLKLVLRDGFSVQRPEQFLQDPMAMMDPMMAAMGGAPPPGGAGAELAGAQLAAGAPGSAQEAAVSPIEGVPPEIIQQLIQQVGLTPQ